MDRKVVALAGGVGGAKLADGLAACLAPENLTIVVNTADDFTHLGLHISPDIDTVTYTLAGVASPERGWGRADETWAFLQTLEELGGPTWFQLGDRDLALHHIRTMGIAEGKRLSLITAEIKDRLGVKVSILPMSDDTVQTMVISDEGRLPFQEYFVARQCTPIVRKFDFVGIEEARAAPGVLDSLEQADYIVLCPSNPWVSLDPILAIRDVRDCLRTKAVFMVSPILAGKAVKGPAAKMYAELGIEPSALAVAEHFADLLNGIMIDTDDSEIAGVIESLGIQVHLEPILMKDSEDRVRVAKALLAFAHGSLEKEKQP